MYFKFYFGFFIKKKYIPLFLVDGLLVDGLLVDGLLVDGARLVDAGTRAGFSAAHRTVRRCRHPRRIQRCTPHSSSVQAPAQDSALHAAQFVGAGTRAGFSAARCTVRWRRHPRRIQRCTLHSSLAQAPALHVTGLLLAFADQDEP
jgi:hypothetical protein